jgi:hypothetical protein
MSLSLNLRFVDFHAEFEVNGNYLFETLSKHFEVECNIHRPPDVVFYGDYGNTRLGFKCPKVYVSEEPSWPNFDNCDFALTPLQLSDPRQLRLPGYVRWAYSYRKRTKQHALIRSNDFNAERMLATKTKFCNFVFSNWRAQRRRDFLKLLSEYRQVDSAGSVDNTMQGWCVPKGEKLSFISPYKFTIAFENQSLPGYISEKLVEPLAVNSLPIYWGDPHIGAEFNPCSFVDGSCDLHALVEKVVDLDLSDDMYLAQLSATPFVDNVCNLYSRVDYIVPFFENVFQRERIVR